MFMDTLDEFDLARESVENVIYEYQACERADYIEYMSQQAPKDDS